MTVEAIEDIWSRTRGRDWTWADLQQIPDDGHRYEIIDGSLLATPFRVELRPAELAGPRRRA